MRKAFEFFLGLASGFAFSFFFLYLREEFLRYATDEEVLTYLSNASLEFPLDETATNIMLYLTTKLFKDVPEDIRLESLSEYEEYELKRIREKLRQRQWRDFEKWFLSIKKLFGGIDHESKVCQGR